jgi:hypothetical protein
LPLLSVGGIPSFKPVLAFKEPQLIGIILIFIIQGMPGFIAPKKGEP